MEGVYKINTDAVMFEDSQIGLGGVVRDFEGNVVVAMCNKVAGSNDVAVAEALSARQGVQVALEAGFTNLVLEIDNIRVFRSLQDRRFDAAPFGIIIRDIICFEHQCSKLVFSHVKRLGNCVAHGLAKLSQAYNDLHVWLEEAPTEVTRYVLAVKFAE